MLYYLTWFKVKKEDKLLSNKNKLMAILKF